MRSTIIMAAATTLLVAALGNSAPDKAQHSSFMRQSLRLADCDNCGINKLSEDELTNLVTLISARRGMSYLNESAQNYMRSQGWVPTEVIGYQPDTSVTASSDDILMLVIRDGKLYAMEPAMGNESWPTGLYWTKDTFISTWEVLSPEGKVEHCSISELR